MIRTFYLLLFSAMAAHAQDAPACQAFFTLTANGAYPTMNGFDNRTLGCVTWTIGYEATGFSSFTLAFQSSTGANTPTSYGAYTGATVVSSPSFGTSTVGGVATYTNLQAGTVVNTPWVRVNLSSAMGSGLIRGYIYGWKTGETGGTGGGGGGGGGVTSDVNLKQVGGTNTVTGGVAGTQGVGGAAAIGAAAGTPVTTGYRDDAGNVLADYAFPDQASIGFTGTDAVIVTGIASTKTYVGHVSFSLDAPQTVTIQQGTGATCGTNTLVLFGPAPNISSVALDYDSKGALHTTINARDLCLHLGGSATVGGGVTYGTH